MTVHYATASHIGHLRSVNEDAVFASPDHRHFAVFDGMGGAGNGDVASHLCRDVFSSALKGGADIRSSIIACHRAIADKVEANLALPKWAQPLCR